MLNACLLYIKILILTINLLQDLHPRRCRFIYVLPLTVG